MTSWYSNLQKQLEFEPGSTDRTGGLQEGSDRRSQLFFRSSMDLPRRTALDVWLRHVSGRNLNQKHHLEFGPFGELVARALYVTGTWRF